MLHERRAEQEWFTSENTNAAGIPYLRMVLLDNGTYYRLNYNDGAEFVVDRTGTHIFVTRRENQTLEDIVTYLLGPLLGFVLRLRHVTCLHASAVVVNNKVIAFVGDSGTGKSTTAAAFSRRGYPVLSDNLVPVVERGLNYQAQPAYTHLRLRSGAVQALYGQPDALPMIESAQPDWDKRFLELNTPENPFQRFPLPIAAIYQLAERSGDPRAPYIEPVPAAQWLPVMEANTYKNYMLNDEMRRQESALLSRLVTQVPVRTLVSHQDPDRLLQLCDVVLADYLSLRPIRSQI